MARMRRCQGFPRIFRSVYVLAAWAVPAAGPIDARDGGARAGEQFAVIRPQLQFDVVDRWTTYPGARSTDRNGRLAARGRGGSRRFSGRPSASRLGSGVDGPTTGNSDRRGPRKPSPFEATGATPLMRDLPAAERKPSPTRRRALSW